MKCLRVERQLPFVTRRSNDGQGDWGEEPTSIPSRLEFRVGDDLVADLVEVIELLARAVQL